MTLQTVDGFRVSFTLTAEMCAELGSALEHAAAEGDSKLSGKDNGRREFPQLN
jgi:hypothetical protein